MATILEKALMNRIERASRRVVWQTPMDKIASIAGIYEVIGDYTRPEGVAVHGLGLARHRNGGLVVEAYCECASAQQSQARRSLSVLLEIPQTAIAIVPCWGFRPQVGLGDPGAHHALAARGSFGTVGGFAGDLQSPLILAVSNNHVFADCNQSTQNDPLITSSGQFGGLRRFRPIVSQPAVNDLDGAVGWVRSDEEITTPAVVVGSRPAMRGLRVHKFGAASGHTTGVVVATAATAAVPYPGIGTANFHRCLRIVGDDGPFSVRGDSGSLVLDQRNAVVGIVFAGDETGGYSLANHVDALTGHLNIAF